MYVARTFAPPWSKRLGKVTVTFALGPVAAPPPPPPPSVSPPAPPAPPPHADSRPTPNSNRAAKRSLIGSSNLGGRGGVVRRAASRAASYAWTGAGLVPEIGRASWRGRGEISVG